MGGLIVQFMGTFIYISGEWRVLINYFSCLHNRYELHCRRTFHWEKSKGEKKVCKDEPGEKISECKC